MFSWQLVNLLVSLFLVTGVNCLEPQSLLQAKTHQHEQAGRFVDEQASFDCAQFQLNGTALQPRMGRTPRIFDFFLFGFEGELPVLDLRFAEMAHDLDGIFIVEADRDHKGLPRKLILNELLKKEPMLQYADKIHVIEVFLESTYSHSNASSDRRYDLQKRMIDMVHVAIQKVKTLPGVDLHEDFFIEGDLDEIVSQEALRALRNCQVGKSPHTWPVISVQMDQYYINFGWKDPGGWSFPSIIAPLKDVDYFFGQYGETPRYELHDASELWKPSPAKNATSERSLKLFVEDSKQRRHQHLFSTGKTPQHELYDLVDAQSSTPGRSLKSFVEESRQRRLGEHNGLDLHALELFKSVPCEDDDTMCSLILAELQQIIKQGNPAKVLHRATKSARPVGWHLAWTLDAENTARKLTARAAGRPKWSQNLNGEELIDMTRQKLAEGPQALIGAHVMVNLDVESIPNAAKQDPQRFRHLLGPKLYKVVEKEHRISEVMLWPK